jgi:hypothetical protein
VTGVYAQVALDAIGMDTSSSYNNWMGLAATSDDTNLNNAVEVGVSVYNINGWQTPYVYFSSWEGGYENNFQEATASPGFSLGQTIGVAVSQYQSVWYAYYNLNNGAGWQQFSSRTMNFNSLSYVFSSCESTCSAGYKGNIFGQWSSVQYQYDDGTCYNVDFQSIYTNTFNHFYPETYYNNNAWYGEFTATG